MSKCERNFIRFPSILMKSIISEKEVYRPHSVPELEHYLGRSQHKQNNLVSGKLSNHHMFTIIFVILSATKKKQFLYGNFLATFVYLRNYFYEAY